MRTLATSLARVGDLYDMCYEGVWFVGNALSGPGQVADSSGGFRGGDGFRGGGGRR